MCVPDAREEAGTGQQMCVTAGATGWTLSLFDADATKRV